jgi:ABC-type transporter Mla subunit MlaD
MHISISLDDTITPLFVRLDRIEAKRQELAATIKHAEQVLEDFRRNKEQNFETLHSLPHRERIIGVR